jgi:23S rRNA pseudouridine1911/1915/1917 synthase
MNMLDPEEIDENLLPPNDDEDEKGLYEFKRIRVDPKQAPMRLDKFVQDRVEKISRTRIQDAIKAGQILVDDKIVKSNFQVSPGEEVVMYLADEPFDYELLPENIPLDIRYEDEHILIVHKPVGLVCHPGVGNHTGTLVNGLLYYFQNQYLPIKDGHEHYQTGLVHRIDKDTSGLLVIAKSDAAMQSLSKQFFKHTVKRTYQAIVWGQPDQAEGTIDVNVGRDSRDMKKYITYPEGDQGKHAITHYKTLEAMYYISLVECRLETGRTHQIRVHMKHLGHTLFSDQTYGGNHILKGTVFSNYKQFVEKTFKACPRQALHAKTLGFIHPGTNEEVFFESELPTDMQTCLDMWRDYLTHRKVAMGG